MSQKALTRAGAILLLLGFGTGIPLSSAMTAGLSLDAHSLLASHLNALMGAFLLWGLAFSLPMTSYGPRARGRLAWTFVVAAYANWAITAVKAGLHVSGLGWNGDPVNDAVLAALTIFVVLPSIAGSAAWVAGLL